MLGFFNIYPFRFSYVADHFQYLASIGRHPLLAAALRRRCQLGLDRAPWLACGHASVCSAIPSWRQTHVYRNDETLYPHHAGAQSRLLDGAQQSRNVPLHTAGRRAGGDRALPDRRSGSSPITPEGHNNLGIGILRKIPGRLL